MYQRRTVASFHLRLPEFRKRCKHIVLFIQTIKSKTTLQAERKRTMFTNSLCIPSAGIVPGSSGPPTWMNVPARTNIHLDDPNWGGALQLSYGQVGIPNQSIT